MQIRQYLLMKKNYAFNGIAQNFCQLKNNSALKSREKDMEKITKDVEKLQEQSKSDQEAHVAAQKHFQAVSAGLSSNADGEDASLNDQLMSEFLTHYHFFEYSIYCLSVSFRFQQS